MSETTIDIDPEWKSDKATIAIAGRDFEVYRLPWPAPDGGRLYGCGILPMRYSLPDLIADIKRAQGPEWRA